MLIMNVKKKKALSYQAEFVENMLISRWIGTMQGDIAGNELFS